MTSHEVADKKLWGITWPLMLEFLLVMQAPALDAYFLSHVSDRAAAAVMSVMPFFMLSILIIHTLNQSGMSVVAQRLGARDTENVNATILTMLIIDLVTCSIIGLLFLFAHRSLAGLLGLTGDLQRYAGDFLSIVGTSIVFLGVRSVYASVTAVHGKTHYNLISSAIMIGVNITLNIVFINGLFGLPKMDVRGVALATVLGWIASVLFNMYIVHRVMGISFPWKDIGGRFKSLARPIMKIGLPSMIEPVSFYSLQLATTAIVVAVGTTALVTRAYVLPVPMLVAVVQLALSIGTQILVGHLIGARRFEDADRQMRSSVLQGVILSVTLASVFFLFSDQLIGLFTTDPEVLALGHNVLLVAIVLEFARPVNTIVSTSLRASGDAKYTSFVSASVMFLFSIPVIYLLAIPLQFGLIGAWIGMAVDEIVRAVLNFRRWNRRHWQKTGIAVRPRQEEMYVEKIA